MGARDPGASVAASSARDLADPPGKVEATSMAIAGPAFAAALLFLRSATPVSPGAWDGAAAALAALGIAPWVHRWRGAFEATLVRGAGLALATFLVANALVPPFRDAALPAAVAVAGGALLQADAKRERPRWTVELAGVATLALAVGLALARSAAFPEPDRLRLALATVAGASLIGLAARRVLVTTKLRWLAPQPIGILLVAALGGIYLSYRALVRAHVANLPIYEWSVATGIAGLLLARLRRQVKSREVADAWTGLARRHAQDVRPVYDERMGPLAAAIGRYLEQGVGYDDYRRILIERIGEAPAPIPNGRTKGARAAARARREAAHDAAMNGMDRGQAHGTPLQQPGVR